MPTVSALKAARGGRIAVHLDGEYACSVSQRVIARLRLHEGRLLSEEEAEALQREAEQDRALQAAYRLLSHRQRSTRELADRLAAKQITAEVVAATVASLQSQGLLDDAAFAAAFVADKRRLQNWSSRRIDLELQRLGVAPHVIRAALASSDAVPKAADAASSVADAAGGEEAEAARADAALAKLGAARPPLEAARRRAFAYLQRRGFSTPVSYAAVQRWAASRPDAEIDCHDG